MSTPGTWHGQASSSVATNTSVVAGPADRVWTQLQTALDRVKATWLSEPPSVRRRRARAFATQAAVSLTQLDLSRVAAAAVRDVIGLATLTVNAELPGRHPLPNGFVSGAISDLEDDLTAAVSYTLQTARSLSHWLERAASMEGNAHDQARILERGLQDRGMAAVVYKDGSRHGLGEYTRMATRTSLAETWQMTTLAVMRSAGVEWVEISDGAGCGWTRHDDPEKANGTIRSVDEAGGYPLAHPNCGRTWFPRVDLSAGTPDPRTSQPLASGPTPDRNAADVPAVRAPSGRLNVRAAAVLAPAAARHAQTLARVASRNIPGLGLRPAGAARASLATRRTGPTRTPGGSGTP